ncbi:hypothetical protein CY34DRAFT_14533 [Suillus luteus UH-Slu-Lm8-n1]|uniref:CCHC-type domain-containing protein n=1 Tax=Suillus luteus UH-Slu-Lm8-n1 TaxID=930992 RepID=A0A0D0AXU8_9AGAM|nr:hypothetical protein CY34DRAFT_14533 [Suillus luteus UH-Slu-Lm8-n1]
MIVFLAYALSSSSLSILTVMQAEIPGQDQYGYDAVPNFFQGMPERDAASGASKDVNVELIPDEDYHNPPSLDQKAPKPILPPPAPQIATEDPPTTSLPDLELGIQAAPILVDSPSPPPNARVARKEQKRWLRINSKSVSPNKSPTKVSPTFSLSSKSPADYNNFVCHNCKVLGHRHKHCPKYWCHVCYRNAPGHLSIYCKQLDEKKEKKQIREPPSDDQDLGYMKRLSRTEDPNLFRNSLEL